MSPDRFTLHGPVRVSADRTHLAHADGTPFFFLADTAWNGPLLAADADWSTYLDDRAAKGFTAIQFITHAPWTAALTDRQGQTAFPDGRPNEAFFDRIDRAIQAINARGLLAVPVLAWAANFGASGRLNIGYQLPADQLIPLIRYQVARFARHHVLWVLAGDGVYNFFRARKWKQIGRAVFGDHAGRAPVTIHPAGGTWPHDAFRDEPWLDLYGYQSSHSEHDSTLRFLQAGPPATLWRHHLRPTINLEPVYEGIAPGVPPFDNAAVRRATYWSLLNAPTAGVAYGAHGVWSWTTDASEPLNHPGMGVAQPWHTAIHFPGSHDMRRAAEFFTSIKWWTLSPDPSLVPAQSPGPHYIAAARSPDADLAVLYLPRGGPLTVFDGYLRPDLTATWFNPRTADRTPTTRARQMTAPDTNDWLLLLS